MAISVRRAPAAQEDADNEAQAQAQAAVEANLAYRSGLREKWLRSIIRFGRGVTLMQELEWEWEEPDWTADPEMWPGIAKLLYVHCLIGRYEHDLGFLEAAYGSEPICPDCYPEKPSHSRYVRVRCEAHELQFVVWGAQAIAHHIYDSQGLTEREREQLAHDASAAAAMGETSVPAGFVTPLCACGDKRNMHEGAKTFCLRPGCTCQKYAGVAS